MSAVIGPWQPEVESYDEYMHRVVRNAGRPTPEVAAELAALLRVDARGGGADG